MQPRTEIVDAFSRAWEARDLASVMALMTQDCEFHSSVGPGPGSSYVGRAAVESAFASFLQPLPPGDSVENTTSTCHVGADMAVARNVQRRTDAGGAVIVTRICDVFEFEGDLIRIKDTWRKVVGAAPV